MTSRPIDGATLGYCHSHNARRSMHGHLPDTANIFIEADVQTAVQRVLHAPMQAHRIQDLLSAAGQRASEVAGFDRHLLAQCIGSDQVGQGVVLSLALPHFVC
jgi:hypothetical protein